MSLRPLLVLLGGSAIVFASRATAQASDTTWKAYLRRVGPVQFGMSVAQAARALQDPNAGIEGVTPPCDQLGSNKIPEHVVFTVRNDTIVGVTVDNASVRTVRGAGIGDSEELIKSLYGSRLRVEPHPRFPRGHYLVYLPADSADQRFTMIFETDGDRVLWYRVGFSASADSTWGCP